MNHTSFRLVLARCVCLRFTCGLADVLGAALPVPHMQEVPQFKRICWQRMPCACRQQQSHLTLWLQIYTCSSGSSTCIQYRSIPDPGHLA